MGRFTSGRAAGLRRRRAIGVGVVVLFLAAWALERHRDAPLARL